MPRNAGHLSLARLLVAAPMPSHFRWGWFGITRPHSDPEVRGHVSAGSGVRGLEGHPPRAADGQGVTRGGREACALPGSFWGRGVRWGALLPGPGADTSVPYACDSAFGQGASC